MRVALSTFVTIKIEFDSSCEDGIAVAVPGEKLVLAVDDRQTVHRVAVISASRSLIGWLPSDDPLIPKLFNGAQYQAHLQKVVRGRGGRRFASVYIAVGLLDTEMDVPTV